MFAYSRLGDVGEVGKAPSWLLPVLGTVAAVGLGVAAYEYWPKSTPAGAPVPVPSPTAVPGQTPAQNQQSKSIWTSISDFFTGSGMSQGAANAAAKAIATGQAPVPAGLPQHLASHPATASMFGGFAGLSPMLMIGGLAVLGGLAFFMSRPRRGRKR